MIIDKESVLSRPVCIAGEAFPDEVLNEISKEFTLFVLPKDPELPEGVSGHGDLLVFSAFDRLVVRASYYERNRNLFRAAAGEAGKEIVISERAVGKRYPDDCGFCMRFVPFGKQPFIIFNPLSADDVALRMALESGCKPVRVRQGYSACSAVAVADGAVITADRGIAKVAEYEGIECLLIKPGGITLPGYPAGGKDDRGFIGGACGLYGNRLIFAGDYNTLPDADDIASFCLKHGTLPVSVCSGAPFDGGGLIFFDGVKR
ncbi:MAG: hypothetical protein MJ137_05790 [Clostridia bacterium]|nr:hypothetical protein [Clostridia bacterium]